MPDQSTLLSLPYIQPSQAQKHVTHNQAVRKLDHIVQLVIQGEPLASAPATPVVGDRYIVAGGATGVWAGKDNSIAVYEDTGWVFTTPTLGWIVQVVADTHIRMFDGSEWIKPSMNNLPGIGIGASWDATNRLSISSDASLFNNAGNGHQIKINKASLADSATILFQDNWSGRAEIGLAGDNNLHFKVSGDGSLWSEAMIINSTDGRVSFPSGGVREALNGARIYYVNAGSGSDTNDGQTPVTAFGTIQKAVEQSQKIDCNGFSVTIQLADGVYAENVVVDQNSVGGPRIKIKGNATTPQNTKISAASGTTIAWKNHARGEIIDVQLENSGSNTLMALSQGADVNIGNIVFKDATSGSHIDMRENSLLRVIADYTVSGSAQHHLALRSGSVFAIDTKTATISGSPHFSVAFTMCTHGACYDQNAANWNGSASGKRYEISMNASCNGGAATHFPGDLAGTTATGGQYGS